MIATFFTTLTPGGNWLLGTSAAFASVAAIVGFTRPGYPGFAAVRLTRAVLATIYASLYWLDLLDVLRPVNRLGLSQIFAPFAWVLVWIVPTLAVPKKEEKIEDRVMEAVATAIAPTSQETP